MFLLLRLLPFTSHPFLPHPFSPYLFLFPLVVGGPREVTVEGDQKRVRLEGLQPATTYTLTVVAENRVGRSQPSPPLTASTHEEPPTGYPQSVAVSCVCCCVVRELCVAVLWGVVVSRSV